MVLTGLYNLITDCITLRLDFLLHIENMDDLVKLGFDDLYKLVLIT